MVAIASFGAPGCAGQAVPDADGEGEEGADEQALGSACPTLPETPKKYGFYTVRDELQAAFTDAGGVVYVENVKEYRPPLFNFIPAAERKKCYRLWRAGSPDRPLELLREQPGTAYYPPNLYGMTRAGYVTTFVARDHEGANLFDLTFLAGGKTTIKDDPVACQNGPSWIMPSPDGQRLALVRLVLRLDRCDVGPPRDGVMQRVQVRYYDATGKQVMSEVGVDFDTLNSNPQWTWTPAGEFVVSDGATAFAISEDGVAHPRAVPGCFEPPTSSSEVAADGAVVSRNGWAGGVPQISIGPAGERPAFGCQ